MANILVLLVNKYQFWKIIIVPYFHELRKTLYNNKRQPALEKNTTYIIHPFRYGYKAQNAIFNKTND